MLAFLPDKAMARSFQASVVALSLILLGCSSDIPSCGDSFVSKNLIDIFTKRNILTNWIMDEGGLFLTPKKTQPACPDSDSYVDGRGNKQCRSTSLEPYKLVDWKIVNIFETGLANKSRSCAAVADMRFTSAGWMRTIVFPIKYDLVFLEDKKEWNINLNMNMKNWKLSDST